ncbi:MAG: hypothetical protein AAFQ94_24580, partial [Bacteroidota bacterium]
MEQKKQYILKAVLGVFCLFLIATLLVWSLWNWLIPEIFGLKRLSFAEAGGLLFLSKLLLGGFNTDHFKKKMSADYWESKFVNQQQDSYHLTSEQK